MTIERAISDMDAEELKKLVVAIHHTLWNPDEHWDDVEWTPETVEQVAEVFANENLHPYELIEYNE